MKTPDKHPPTSAPRRTASLMHNNLIRGMATTLSCDSWVGADNGSEFPKSMEVNHVCTHPVIGGYLGATSEDNERGINGGYKSESGGHKVGNVANKGGDNGDKPPHLPTAARCQEILMDYVLMRATLLSAHVRHILDPRFDTVLASEDRAFKERVEAFLRDVEGSEARKSEAWVSLRKRLEDFGLMSEGERKYCETLGRRRSSSSNLVFKRSSPRQATPEPRQTNNAVDEEIDGMVSRIKADSSLRRRAALSSPFKGPIHESPAFADVASACCPDPASLDRIRSRLAQGPHAGLSSLFRSPGHVFVTSTDIIRVHCSAFLIPVSLPRPPSARRPNLPHLPNGTIWSQYRKHLANTDPHLLRKLLPTRSTADLLYHSDLTASLTHWDWSSDLPAPVCGEVGFPLQSADPHISNLVATAESFIDTTLDLLRRHRPEPPAMRPRHLLAIPVIGTGGGRAGDVTGNVITALLTLFSKKVEENRDLDVVLVCAEPAVFTHAQSIRRDLAKKGSAGWTSFNIIDPLLQSGKELAVLAAKGELSVFVGAGVSMAAGSPSWGELLGRVEDQFYEPRKIFERVHWDYLKYADSLYWLCKKKDKGGKVRTLKERIAHLVTSRHPSLLATLIASLPCKNIITSNFDTHMEIACRSVNLASTSKEDLSVIPYNPVKGARRWLLKIHGCITRPSEIVITSRDYRRHRRALASLVQANLLTTHMMFIGFSGKDPNYLKLIQEVREAMIPQKEVSDSTWSRGVDTGTTRYAAMGLLGAVVAVAVAVAAARTRKMWI